MQFTRMPCSASSTAIDRVKWMTAAFVARYAITPEPALIPPIDVVLTMAPPPCVGHVPGRALAADHHAEDVHGHDPVEVGEVVVEEALERTADAGVVAHDVQAAEALDREVDDGLDLVRVADVGLLERGRRPELLGERLAAVAVDVGDDDAARPPRRTARPWRAPTRSRHR